MEEPHKFESWSLANLMELMVSWYDYHQVTMETVQRPDVKSGIWITIKITRKLYDDNVFRPKNDYMISGQSGAIVRRRLIEFLYREIPTGK